MLKEISQSQQILWIVNVAAGALLLVLLGVRKNYRTYPAFTFYVFANLALGISLFIIYRRWGFSSTASWLFAWGMQALVICARALAVAEVCKHLLSRYRGVWALAWRVLLACAAIVLLYSGLAARDGWAFVLPKAERALELAIATVIVGVFLFVRYYGVAAEPVDRSLAIGFCLYSCFRVLNNSILVRFLDNYLTLWNFLGMLAFLGSLLLWSWALRKPQAEAGPEEALLPAEVYQTLAPQFNLRLRLLNEQLAQLWKTEATRN